MSAQPSLADVRAIVREILAAHGRLAVPAADVADDADLYDAGLTSHASVNLMLALEDRFAVEFPERMLRRRAFESIAVIADGVAGLLAEQAVA